MNFKNMRNIEENSFDQFKNDIFVEITDPFDMLPFFKAPNLPNIDFHESMQIQLTWNIHILLVLAITPLTVISIITQPFYALYYGLCLLLIIGSLLFIKLTGNSRVFSIYVAVTLYAMIMYSMFRVDNYIHYIEPFWALVIVLYVYFIHGKVWGGLAMLATVISTSLFFFFNLNATIGNINEMNFSELLSMGLEFSICLSLIGYILHQFIFLKNHSELELKMMNTALRKEKDIVESRDKEKTILLQEIHHRVKNNLQIVMSLLRMQSSKIASAETTEHFNDAINRILTMSLIHQKLYESDNLSAVDFSEYIDALATDLLRSSHARQEIEKSFSIDVQNIGMKTIVPVALIITELLSNSAKHAFDTVKSPKISLSVRILEDTGLLQLRYSDNGTWKKSNKASFGMELIGALTEQLEGHYDLEIGDNKSVYTFHFKQLD